MRTLLETRLSNELDHTGAEEYTPYRQYIQEMRNKGVLTKDPKWRTTHLPTKEWTVKDWWYWTWSVDYTKP